MIGRIEGRYHAEPERPTHAFYPHLLVLPSLEEGFGLPAVEAMACGTPVISSNRGSLPEILGDAGRFFDPYQMEMLLGELRGLLAHDYLLKEMREIGLVRSKQFTWDEAAKKVVPSFTALSDGYMVHG